MVKYKWDRPSQFLIYHLEMNFTISILILKALTQRLVIKIPLKFSKTFFCMLNFPFWPSLLLVWSQYLICWCPMTQCDKWGIIQPYLLFTVSENFNLLMLFWVETQSDYVEIATILVINQQKDIVFHFFMIYNFPHCKTQN